MVRALMSDPVLLSSFATLPSRADADDDDEGPDEVGQGVRLSVAFGSSAAALLRKVRGDPDVDVVPEQVMALQEKLREELECPGAVIKYN